MNDRDDPSTNRVPDDAPVRSSTDASRIDALERELRESREKLERLEREITVLRRASAGTLQSSPGVGRTMASAPAAPAVRSSGSGLIVGVAMLLLGAVAVGAFLTVKRKDDRRTSTSDTSAPPRVAFPVPVVDNGNDKANPSGGGVVPPGEHLQWGIGFGPSVTPVAINDDGIEDFVGAYRLVGEDVYIGAFDGKTLQRIWKSPPLGSLSEAVTATHFALVGRRVVVTDFRSNVHVFDVATGSLVGSAHLTDKARRVCVSARHENQAWIEVVDHKNVLFDVGTLSTSAAPEPDWCKGYSPFNRVCASTSAACTEGRVTAEGFQASYVLGTDDPIVRVAVGTRHPGTQTAMAAGLDASSKATWLAVLPKDPAVAPGGAPIADLSRGKLFAAFQADPHGFVLASLDAASGRREWEVPIPRSESGSGPEGVTATATRVYVPHWTWLDIFQTDGGRLVGTVGIW